MLGEEKEERASIFPNNITFQASIFEYKRKMKA
jgi:hypothetical protein